MKKARSDPINPHDKYHHTDYLIWFMDTLHTHPIALNRIKRAIKQVKFEKMRYEIVSNYTTKQYQK